MALGFGRSNTYPMQEGAFFGNIFVSPPQAYYCNGYDGDRGPVAGRIGANTSGSPYRNPFSGSGLCQNNCSAVGWNGEAFANCAGFGNNVVTVYRDFDPSVPYTICNKYTGKCLDVSGSSTSAGTPIVMSSPTGAKSQKFYFERASVASHDGNYRVRSATSGLYVDINGGSTASGATALQWSNNGGTSQMWNMVQVVAGSYLMENDRSRLLLNAAGVPAGAPVPQKGSGYYTDFQMWKLTLADATGTGGSTSTGGSGGSTGGTNPCAAFCGSPTVMSTQSYGNSNIGTAAACYSTTFPITAMNCGNMTGRTLSVNGTAINCNSPTLPAKVNGGYCFQATAGGLSYAYFGAW